ncbi:HDOD domain-containing protein [Endothiovibrio diazotrophicus]
MSEGEGDRASIRQRIEAITELPAMPEMARRLLVLRSNPYSDVDDLAKVVELDPSLSAQIIRYARSPFFSYRGKVVSVQSAISRVLGYEPVMNIALGIASASPFRIPLAGPLGLRHYWRDAIYCAALCQALINALPYQQRPKPGLAYLGGLLHNFGVVLLGHLFPEEFERLNLRLEAEPETPIAEHERSMLDAGHAELGEWLMAAWRMPAELVTAVAEHHNPDYDGVHSAYPNLVLVANRLLRAHRVGEGESDELPASLMERLSLHEDHARRVLEGVMEGRQGLDDMAEQMVS